MMRLRVPSTALRAGPDDPGIYYSQTTGVSWSTFLNFCQRDEMREMKKKIMSIGSIQYCEGTLIGDDGCL